MNTGKYDQIVTALQETVWPSYAKMFTTLTSNGVPPEYATTLVNAEMQRHFEAARPNSGSMTLRQVKVNGYSGRFWLLSIDVGDVTAYVLEETGDVTRVQVTDLLPA